MSTFVSTVLPLTVPFRFDLSLAYLRRRAGELVDRVEGGRYRRLLHTPGGLILLEVAEEQGALCLSVPYATAPIDQGFIEAHVRRIFSLDTPLEEFYQLAREDPGLAPIVSSLSGLRPVLAASPFEALVWAIVGQQITLQFAFTLKARLVQQYSELVDVGGTTYWTFPTCEVLAAANPEDLRGMQFSRSKAEYIVGLARAVASGELDLDALSTISEAERIECLVRLRGIGRWTAEYGSMRGYGARDSLPAADIGLRNAVTVAYRLDHQATEAEVRAMGERWTPWRAFATFYLWATLWSL